MRARPGGRPGPAYRAVLLAAGIGLGTSAAAADVRGVVRNGTTGKPAAGDEVLVFDVAGAAPSEVGRARTDAAGRFHVRVPEEESPRLVRAVHEGLGYQAMVPSGGEPVRLEVFDVTARPDGVAVTADIRLEAEGSSLNVIEELSVRNASAPPRTVRTGRPFAVRLPPEARVVAGAMQAPGRQAANVRPIPGARKGEYGFPLVLLPGESRIAVAFTLPWAGAAVIEPDTPYPLSRIVAVHPKSMTFEPSASGLWEAAADEARAAVRETAHPAPGATVAFRISGTASRAGSAGLVGGAGTASDASLAFVRTAPSHGAAAAPARRLEALSPTRRLFLAGLVVFLAAAVAWVVARRGRRSSSRPVAAAAGSPPGSPAAARVASAVASPAASSLRRLPP